MKLTVSFGGTKVVVPCGDGGMSVRDLIEKAMHRYKKSVSRDSSPLSQSLSGQGRVHSVTLARDGGLLDWDDCVRDVLDDRELVIAHVGGGVGPGVPLPGDGTSASGESLLSTASPSSSAAAVSGRLRTVTATAVPGRLPRGPAPPVPMKPSGAGPEAVVVTSSDISQGSKLLVRSGSDPRGGGPSPARRSSLVGAVNGRVTAAGDDDSDESDDYTKPGPRKPGRCPAGPPGSEAFARSAARQSLGNNPALLRWLDAQDHLAATEPEDLRSEPAGRSSPEASPPSADPSLLVIISSNSEAGRGSEGGLIGVSVKPWYLEEAPIEAHSPGACPLPPSSQRLIRGMEVHYVAEGGRLHRDGRVKAGDRIVEVNELPLQGLTYARAQEIFRKSSQASELRLRVLPAGSPVTAARGKAPGLARTPSDDGSGSGHSRLNSQASAPPVPKRSPHTQLTSGPMPDEKDGPGARASTPKNASIDRSAANTKKIGAKLEVQLSKDKDGLGFSLTTRDNATNGPNPVYVKNILPHGNAIKDGRLRAGDRVLEVNGADVSRSSQPEVVRLLRAIPVGSTVHLLVSRIQEALNGDSASSDKAAEDVGDAEDLEDVMMDLDIPLNETGAAGLGISVKGRSRQKGCDESTDPEKEGVFINSIITGGAASRDGRLRVNDQLLEVNGKALKGLPNRQAMAILREAMQMRQGPRPGFIRLKMARKQRRVTAHVHQRQFHAPAENKVSHNPAYQDTSAASTPLDSPQKRLRRKLPPEPKAPSSGRLSATPTGSSVSTAMRRFASAEHLDAAFAEGNADLPSSSSSSSTSLERAGPRESTRRGRTTFRREGPGRRSMSEKRRAHADARKFEFYEEWKAARSAREGHASSVSPELKPSQSNINLNLPPKATSSAAKFEPLLLGNGALPPSLSFEPGSGPGGSGGLKRAISMESMLSSVRSDAVAATSGVGGAATTGRPLSRNRPNNNSFRRAVDPSYSSGKHGPAPQPPRKAPTGPGNGVTGSSSTTTATNNNNNNNNNSSSKDKDPGGFFKSLFRRGGPNVPAKAAPLPPPPTAASLPSTPVTSGPATQPPFAARQRSAVATTATTAAPPPPPPPPPPPRANLPMPVPVVDNTISSVESRVLQWQRQNAAAMQQQQAAAAAAFSGTPKRAPPAPPPVNYELRGPPPMVSASVQPAPPLPPPPNSRMRSPPVTSSRHSGSRPGLRRTYSRPLHTYTRIWADTSLWGGPAHSPSLPGKAQRQRRLETRTPPARPPPPLAPLHPEPGRRQRPATPCSATTWSAIIRTSTRE